MTAPFHNRMEGGEKLAREILVRRPAHPVVLAIPRGGAPVGQALARALACPFDIIPLIKIPVPWAPEASYGAVASDGTRAINEPLLHRFELSEKELDVAIQAVLPIVKKREELYRQDRPFPSLKGKTVIITDDGLASGHTMLAAVRFVKNKGPASIVVAVPVASEQGYALLSSEPGINEIVVLVKDREQVFSLPAFYKDFDTISDDDVVQHLADGENH